MQVRETQVHGHAVVTMESDLLSLTVVAGKGADIVSFVYLPTGTEFFWRSPRGLDVLLQPADEIRYIGGWIEAFPNAWSACSHRGRELRGYGDVWQLPWEYRIVSADAAAVVVEFYVRSNDLPLLLNKRIALCAGSPSVRIEETVTSLGEETVDFTWGQHPNLGRPFLDEHCRIDLPPCDIYDGERKAGEWPFLIEKAGTGPSDLRVVPEYGTSAENRQVCLRNLAEPTAAVRNLRTGLGFRLTWDPVTFTDLLLWRSFATERSEMFGDNQILCFFPKRSHRNVADAAAAGEALTLAPGESLTSWIEAQVETTAANP